MDYMLNGTLVISNGLERIDMEYNITNEFVIETKPIVIIQNYIDKIDATFDFSKVPKELHQSYLQYIINNGM